MKTVILTVAAATVLLSQGCEPEGGPRPTKGTVPAGIAGSFAPTRIEIIGLTDITSHDAVSLNAAKLNIYVDVLDAYDSRIKAPGKFRFELYEFVPRSSDPRGERIMHWSDIDLTEAEVNNAYWQDYLRTYQFSLDMDFEPEKNGTFVLEATIVTAFGSRLTNTYKLQY